MKVKVKSCCWCKEWSLLIRLTEGLCLLTNSLVKRATGKPTSVVSDYYWRARLRTRDSARSRGSRVVSTHGLNTQRMSAVQKVWSSYVYATILLQHGPTALAPMIRAVWFSCKFYLLLFVKGFDSTDVYYIVNYSFLEANRSVIINLCDLVGTIIL